MNKVKFPQEIRVSTEQLSLLRSGTPDDRLSLITIIFKEVGLEIESYRRQSFMWHYVTVNGGVAYLLDFSHGGGTSGFQRKSEKTLK